MEVNFKKPEGMHRELWGLLWTDNRWAHCCSARYSFLVRSAKQFP